MSLGAKEAIELSTVALRAVCMPSCHEGIWAVTIDLMCLLGI